MEIFRKLIENLKRTAIECRLCQKTMVSHLLSFGFTNVCVLQINIVINSACTCRVLPNAKQPKTGKAQPHRKLHFSTRRLSFKVELWKSENLQAYHHHYHHSSHHRHQKQNSIIIHLIWLQTNSEPNFDGKFCYRKLWNALVCFAQLYVSR